MIRTIPVPANTLRILADAARRIPSTASHDEAQAIADAVQHAELLLRLPTTERAA